MAKKQEAAAGAETGSEHTTPAQKKREEKQSRWTAALCMKFAKRFDNEMDWAAGAPSSYKAAVARGFLKDCTKHMTGKSAAKPAAAKKTVATKAPGKKKKTA